MTTIKVTCPECGDIDLAPGDLSLCIAPHWATYSFGCPECGETLRKSADSEIVDLLSSAGVPTVHVPAEALEPHSGGPIGYDDLLDFALVLEDDGAMAAGLARISTPLAPRARKRRIRR